MAGTNVGPLAEIGFAEDNGAGGAQLLRYEGILGRPGADERERPGGGHHLVGGIDVVFDEHGDAVQGAARTFGLAFLIERIGDGEGVGVEFEHAVEGWAVLVDFADAGSVLLDERASGELAGVQAVLQG